MRYCFETYNFLAIPQSPKMHALPLVNDMYILMPIKGKHKLSIGLPLALCANSPTIATLCWINIKA